MLSIISLITEGNTNSILHASISLVCCSGVSTCTCKKSSVSRLGQQAQVYFTAAIRAEHRSPKWRGDPLLFSVY